MHSPTERARGLVRVDGESGESFSRGFAGLGDSCNTPRYP